MSEQHQQLKAVHIFKPDFITSKTVFYGCFMLPFKDELIARFAGVLNMWAKGKHLTTVTIGTDFATIELIIGGLLQVKKADGNLSRAARMLGITRPQLAYRLKKTSA